MILCANLLAQQNLCAKAEAHADAQEHIQQLTANANGGKSRRTNHLAHHHHVHHAVNGLECIGKGNGNGEDRKLSKHRALGHVPCNIVLTHKNLLFFP